MVTGSWKLIHYPQIGKYQLFDLKNDPNETRDCSTDPAYADRLARLRNKLEVWQKKSGDPLVSQPPRQEK